MNIESNHLSDEEAGRIADFYFTIWDNQVDKQWFWLALRALKKKGLLYYESTEEENRARERIALLAIHYYEVCYRSGYFGGIYFHYWPDHTFRSLDRDLSEEAEDLLSEIHYAILELFDDVDSMLIEMLLNFSMGSSNRIYTQQERNKKIEEIQNSIDLPGSHENDALCWLCSGMEMDRLESYQKNLY